MMSSPPSDRDKSLPALRPVERPGSPSCFCGLVLIIHIQTI